VDERAYIEQHQQSWQELKTSIDTARRRGIHALSPDQLEQIGAQYRMVVAQLSFVRAQGMSDQLVSYLNDLASGAHGLLYTRRSFKAHALSQFFLREFPELFRQNLRFTVVAALIFVLGWATAEAIVRSDPTSASEVMPQKIRSLSESPKEAPDPVLLSSFIMSNNIRVGILAFAGGVTAAFLTVWMLFYNGLTIGLVAHLAGQGGEGLLFWAYVLPHGLIELTAIFICGGSGLMMGSALLAPGNIRRGDALKLAAGPAVRMVAGCIPMFIVAGIIEGFVTPSVLPANAKLLFAGITLLGLVAYFGLVGKSPGTALAGPASTTALPGI
jgi:uncharacterized membrane protein SpoIIM required for sporulation